MQDYFETQPPISPSDSDSPFLSAQEQWDDTLDALAVAVSREIAAKGLLRKGAAKTVRFHFRGYARRLLVPVLDETQRELSRGFEQERTLTDENIKLRAGIRGMRQARRHEIRAAAIGAAILASTVTALFVSILG